MSGKASRANNASKSCMLSKIVTVACAAVASISLVGHDDNDNDNGNENTVIVSKVVIAASGAMAAHALVGRLFTLLSSSCSGSKFETTEEEEGEEEEEEEEDNSMTDEKTIGWSFPPHCWIKCNVDGSAPEDKPSGCGGVFRDSNGSWRYGFAKSFNRCTSSAAELTAISTALDIAWDHGFRKLILETDSLTAADVVNKKNGSSARRHQEKVLVESIDKKKKRKWDVQIVHSNREGNKVADWLANLSHGLHVDDQIELLKLPDGCRSCHDLLLEDMRLAKIKAGRSDRYIRMKGTAFVLVMFLVFLLYVVQVPS